PWPAAMRIFSFIAIFQTKTRRTETTARSSRTLPRSAFHLAVSSRSPRPRVAQFSRTLLLLRRRSPRTGRRLGFWLLCPVPRLGLHRNTRGECDHLRFARHAGQR